VTHASCMDVAREVLDEWVDEWGERRSQPSYCDLLHEDPKEVAHRLRVLASRKREKADG
jgi:hypothetical protein